MVEVVWPEPSGDDLHGDALGKQLGGDVVPEVVEPDPVNVDLVAQLPELEGGPVRRPRRLPGVVAEPPDGSAEAVREREARLPVPFADEGRPEDVAGRDDTVPSASGLRVDGDHTGAWRVGERASDRGPRRRKVVPLEGTTSPRRASVHSATSR